MSWITIVWSMAAAAALTLGSVHLFVWLHERRALANLMFAVVAFSVAGMGLTEVGMMHSATPQEWGRWLQWFHVPLAVAIAGTVAFVRLLLGTGNAWLAWFIVAIRCLVLLGNFLRPPNFTYREIATLARLPLLGEQVAVAGQVVRSPWQWLPSASVLLFAVFVVHAAVKLWQRGPGEGRRRALVVGGGVAAFVVLSIGQTQLMVWGFFQMPVLMSPPFLILLLVMAAEMSRDLLLSKRAQHHAVQLRHELAHVARVTTMGQLASALAHELRQPLGAIQRNVEAAELLLKAGTPNLEELRDIVADINRDDQRAGAVITRLRVQLERRKVEARPLALGELVSETVALVRSEVAARRVSLQCVIPSDLPPVSADRVQLAQVLLNLILNGLDAVEGLAEGQRWVVLAVRHGGARLLEIAVTDSGSGVQAPLAERIFEAFFTTKADGMGMGLAISRNIIEANGGELWLDQRAGQGATFRLTLPVVSQVPSVAVPGATPEPSIAR